MNCLIYARVSTEEQAELSIPAQVQAMRDYATRLGWTIVAEYLEPGVSGRSMERRTALQAMLTRCRENPRVDVVLVHKIDRLARSVFDHATIRFMLQQRSIKLASVVENVDDSVSGQLLENIMASIAQFYSANLGEEVKKGMRIKVERGGWPHKPPRGYRVVRNGDRRSSIDFDEPAASSLRWAFETYAEGWTSIWQVAKELASKGVVDRRGRPIPMETMRAILKNPFYAGRVRWKDAEYAGKHRALISPELFARVQQIMRQHRGDPIERSRRHHFWLRRVAVCAECGSKLTAEHHPRGSYYRCSRNTRARGLCRAKFSNVRTAHDSTLQLYRRLNIPKRLKTELRKAAAGVLKRRAEVLAGQLESLKMKKVKAEEREMRVSEAFASGDMSPKAYRAVATKLRHEVLTMDLTIREGTVDPAALTRKLESALSITASLFDLHSRLDPKGQAILLRTVFRSLVLERGAVVGYQLHPPFDRLLCDAPDGSDCSPGSRLPFDETEVTSTINSILEHDVGPLLELSQGARAAA